MSFSIQQIEKQRSKELRKDIKEVHIDIDDLVGAPKDALPNAYDTLGNQLSMGKEMNIFDQ